MTTPSTAELAAGYAATRSEALNAGAKLGSNLAAVLISAAVVLAVWTTLDPQPGPLISWVEGATAPAISAATLAAIAALAGTVALSKLHVSHTLGRALNGAVAAWRRIVGALLFAAAPAILFASDPLLWAAAIGVAGWVPTWFEPAT